MVNKITYGALQTMNDQTAANLAKLSYEEWALDGTNLSSTQLNGARLIGLDLTHIGKLSDTPTVSRPPDKGMIATRTR